MSLPIWDLVRLVVARFLDFLLFRYLSRTAGGRDLRFLRFLRLFGAADEAERQKTCNRSRKDDALHEWNTPGDVGQSLIIPDKQRTLTAATHVSVHCVHAMQAMDTGIHDIHLRRQRNRSISGNT